MWVILSTPVIQQLPLSAAVSESFLYDSISLSRGRGGVLVHYLITTLLQVRSHRRISTGSRSGSSPGRVSDHGSAARPVSHQPSLFRMSSSSCFSKTPADVFPSWLLCSHTHTHTHTPECSRSADITFYGGSAHLLMISIVSSWYLVSPTRPLMFLVSLLYHK